MAPMMRTPMTRTLLAAACAVALFAPAATLSSAPAFAQAAEGGETVQQVPLTQKQIDGLIAAQPKMNELQKKATSDKPDPKLEGQMAAIAKQNGFASLDEYGAVSDSVSAVLGGIDPDTKTYVGPGPVLKKQIEQVKADKSMPAKDKAEALKQLNEELSGAASAPKPPAGNAELVAKNFDKLAAVLQAGGD